MSNNQVTRPKLNFTVGYGVGFGVSIPITIPETFLKRLKLLFRILIRGLPIRQCPQAKGLLLAGGTSERWNFTIEHPDAEELPKDIPRPDPPPSPHKSCAPLLGQSPIQRALISFRAHGIKNTWVAMPQDSGGSCYKAIEQYLEPYRNPLFLQIEDFPSKINIVESLYYALDEKIRLKPQEQLLVAYSDIVWPVLMMNKLLDQTQGDIVVLVDETWSTHNYPKYRTWHDKTYAELVYGSGDNLEVAGEVVSCFPRGSSHVLTLNDNIALERLYKDKQRCIGEVVGLFKFSKVGCDKFIQVYDHIKSTGTDVQMPDFRALSSVDLESSELLQSRPLNEALLASFLACIEREHPGTVKLLRVRDLRWFEIDHWGDAYLANQDLITWDGYIGEVYRQVTHPDDNSDTDAEK